MKKYFLFLLVLVFCFSFLGINVKSVDAAAGCRDYDYTGEGGGARCITVCWNANEDITFIGDTDTSCDNLAPMPYEVARAQRSNMANFMFTQTLRKGMSGHDVLALQASLNVTGYNAGTPDGKFGPKTEAAVKAWQSVNNLVADGVFGAKSRAAMVTPTLVVSTTPVTSNTDVSATSSNVTTPSIPSTDCTITTTLRLGSAGSEVSCLQKYLGLTDDGKFGPKTETTVKAWQASKGLVADGVFGAQSRAMMASSASTTTNTTTTGDTTTPTTNATQGSTTGSSSSYPVSVYPTTSTSSSSSAGSLNPAFSVTTTTSNTAWAVTSNASWLTPNKAGGIGDSAVGFTFTANPNTTSRTATITISTATSSVTHVFTQSGAQYPIAISPFTSTTDSTAGSLNPAFYVTTTASNTAWAVKSNVSWLTPNKVGGIGDSTVGFTYTANQSAAPRTGVVIVSTATTSAAYTFIQNGTSNPNLPAGCISTDGYSSTTGEPCATLSISPTSSITDSNGGSTASAFSVTSNAPWTVVDNASWLTLNKAGGIGNSTVGFSYTANGATMASRTALITVTAGVRTATFTFVQNGSSTFPITLSPAVGSTNSVAGSMNPAFSVITTASNTAWTVTSNASWLTLNKAGGIGNSTVGFSYTANTSTSQRSATVLVSAETASATYTLTQSGTNSQPTVTISANPMTVSYGGSTTVTWSSVNATSCTGTGGDNLGWSGITKPISGTYYTVPLYNNSTPYGITCYGASGTTPATAQVIITTTPTTTYPVTISPTTATVSSTGGTVSSAFSVITTTSNTAWAVTSNASWLTPNKAGAIGNGTVGYTYTTNPSTASRTATITISTATASAVYTLKQNGIGTTNPAGGNTAPSQGGVLGAETFVFIQRLALGSIGNEVLELQKFLNKSPYNGGLVVDGKFGVSTENVVKKLQMMHELVVDGIVGPAVREILNQ